MHDVFPLAAKIDRPIFMDYINRDGDRRDIRAILLKLDEYWTERGKLRIRLTCREQGVQHKHATNFYAHRILALIDPISGELDENVEAYFRHLLDEIKGRQPEIWPIVEDERLRTTDVGDAFGPWSFGTGDGTPLHEAFKDALDIQRNPNGRKWTRGFPPLLSFSPGDTLYWPAPQPGPWSEQIKTIRLCLQVKKCKPDRIDDAGKKLDGYVIYGMSVVASNDILSAGEWKISQSAFVKLLHDGWHHENWPDFISNLARS